MLYIIKNISNEKIAVGKIVLQPNMEVKSKDIEPFKIMIEQGYLKIINRDNLKETIIKETIIKEDIIEKFIPEEVIIEKDNIKEINIKELKTKEINIKEDNFKEVEKSIKIDMANCLFNFYTEKNLTQEELNKIKKLYKQELIDKNLLNSYNSEIIDLIDCAETYEDLVAVLLNNVYFELLEIYTNN